MAFILLAAGCTDTKRELGLIPSAPDEFTVVKRAPLSMPPDFTLRPPEPGAPRPQDAVSAQDMHSAVFGDKAQAAAPAQGAAAVLQATGATEADPNIRAELDRDAARQVPEKSKPVAQRLFGWSGFGKHSDLPPAQVVDPQAEIARLKKTQAEGQSPSAGGPTPSTTDE